MTTIVAEMTRNERFMQDVRDAAAKAGLELIGVEELDAGNQIAAAATRPDGRRHAVRASPTKATPQEMVDALARPYPARSKL